MAAHSARKVVLLDLDGTLTQSDEGIQTCVKRAYDIMGYPRPTQRQLDTFIGPPIQESMARYGVPENMLDRGIELYREGYNTPLFPDPLHPGQKVPGMYLNKVYDGIDGALDKLRSAGYFLAVATCKPEPQAKSIIEYFGLAGKLDGTWGASLDNSRLHKDQVIRHCFDSIGFDAAAGDRAVMVGDRWTDADGAHAMGLDCIGCEWGYAEPGELADHGVTVFAGHPSDLPRVIDGYFAD